MRFTIKLKLGLTFAVVILLAGATAWLGISHMAALDEQLTGLVEGPMKRLEISERISLDLMRMVRNEKNLTMLGDKDEAARFESEVVKPRQVLMTQLESAEGTAQAQNKPIWAAARTALQQAGTLQDKIRDLIQQGAVDEARRVSAHDVAKYITEVNVNMQKVVDINKQHLEQGKADSDAQYAGARLTMLSMVAAMMVIAISAALWMAISISRALTRAGTLAQAVAGGDLTQTIDNASRDEVGDLIGHINEMVLRLRGVVSEALSAADNVSAALKASDTTPRKRSTISLMWPIRSPTSSREALSMVWVRSPPATAWASVPARVKARLMLMAIHSAAEIAITIMAATIESIVSRAPAYCASESALPCSRCCLLMSTTFCMLTLTSVIYFATSWAETRRASSTAPCWIRSRILSCKVPACCSAVRAAAQIGLFWA